MKVCSSSAGRAISVHSWLFLILIPEFLTACGANALALSLRHKYPLPVRQRIYKISFQRLIASGSLFFRSVISFSSKVQPIFTAPGF